MGEILVSLPGEQVASTVTHYGVWVIPFCKEPHWSWRRVTDPTQCVDLHTVFKTDEGRYIRGELIACAWEA